MESSPNICIGHLKVVDHLILGITDLRLKKKEINITHSTLETKPMNAWDQVCDSLTEKSINGAFVSIPLAMDLFAAGLDIRLLMLTHRSGSVIVKSKSAGIKNIADFKGRTILIPSELSIQNMLLHRLLSFAGLNLDADDNAVPDVTLEVVNPFLMNEILSNDKDEDGIAGFAVAEPFGAEAVHNEIAVKVCTSQSLWKDHPCCAFVLDKSFMDQYPEAIEEIVALFVQTGQYIEDKKKEILSMTQQFLDQKKEVTQHVLFKTAINFSPSLLIPDIGELNTIQNYMADSMGVLKNKIQMDKLVDASLISKLIPRETQ